MEFKDDGKPKQITWRVFQLVPKPESGVWLLFNKKSERKMKTMNLSLNLLLFFFKNRVSMIWLTARPSKLDRDSNVTGFSRSEWSRRIKKLTKRFNLKISLFRSYLNICFPYTSDHIWILFSVHKRSQTVIFEYFCFLTIKFCLLNIFVFSSLLDKLWFMVSY